MEEDFRQTEGKAYMKHQTLEKFQDFQGSERMSICIEHGEWRER